MPRVTLVRGGPAPHAVTLVRSGGSALGVHRAPVTELAGLGVGSALARLGEEQRRPLATAGGVLVPGGVFGNREDRQDHPGTAGPGTLGHGRSDAALYRTVGNTEPAGTGRVSATGDAAGRSPN
jgi:hypothetical protein